ncbi:zinc finger CCCH domain-containing protein 14 [Larimichthys crocea]|uniref:zinc finger CCCH domain-containing protein 14 n=1 Tax=Larimichthys crocea TaxID=215358 RepID=UPI000F5DED53|nr:zinc finger CCCH domain-containing protein 14 [Larimichthys crocea]XP_027140398.1 zinc finger CCCH domain-containing protein 14 [Larimichthys crocea]
MEIGTEISKKIRAAIKGKLQELGAYIDEELPDYIMVMVANKKTSQQMADDLSLFLGSNTIKFTAWLQGVLEKLRSVAVEPASLRHQLQSDGGAAAGKSRSSVSEDGRAEDTKVLTVSSSRSDRTEARVSSSAHESRRGALEKSSSRLTSAVKPLMEPLPSEAVIDIKPEMDDDLIAEDPVEMGTNHGRTRGAASRPTAEIYRPGQSKFTSVNSTDRCRPTEGSSHIRQQDGRGSRSSRTGSSKDELSRKRKAPVASSVVRVSRAADEDSDDMEEEDTGYGGRGLSSRVSLPSKPERKPTLPPAKQANRNLILKAISEAQDSITKTTAYPTIPQRQTVPVAPRTRLASSEEMTAAIQLVQEHLHSLAPRVQAYTSAELPPSRTAAPVKSLASRLQLDLAADSSDGGEQSDYGIEVAAGSEAKPFDTRSFIVSRPQMQEPPTRSQQRLQSLVKDEVQSALPRTVQASKERGDSASPKFIVTLDGVPSPLGGLAECEMELDDVRPSAKVTEATVHANREPKVSVLHRLQRGIASSEDDVMDMEVVEEEVPVKKQKVLERCKFWPVCKSGDECSYHHPTTQCKTFPSCKFGDKCLFVHPNCKYDARCSKPDCPFTHVSRRGAAAPPPRPAVQPAHTTSVCRFFPDCKKMDCPFYHPKPCRFAAQCKRAGCTFYHPTTSVPPRSALKWTKTQSS